MGISESQEKLSLQVTDSTGREKPSRTMPGQMDLRLFTSIRRKLGFLAQRPEKGYSKFYEDQWRVLAMCCGLSLINQLRQRREQGELIKTLMRDYILSKAIVYRYLEKTA